jgi:coenzyme F420-0:L-glutamate ligase/coenzyme F420-1:gamma-L-glutamate ligase
MQLFGIRTELIRPREDIVGAIINGATEQQVKFDDGDILAIASKTVAITQNRLKRLSSVGPSEKARRLALRHDLEPSFVEIVLQEAEKVYGGVSKALLTLKNHILTTNAGVDHKNAPNGYVALWPRRVFRTAEEIRSEILVRTGKSVGVLIVDSRVTPLRMGTTGLALAVAGFKPVRDHRGEKDLYGGSIFITRHAVADDLASAAHLIMGESNEHTPAVLIKGAPVEPADKVKPSSVIIPAEQCLFAKRILQETAKECF